MYSQDLAVLCWRLSYNFVTRKWKQMTARSNCTDQPLRGMFRWLYFFFIQEKKILAYLYGFSWNEPLRVHPGLFLSLVSNGFIVKCGRFYTFHGFLWIFLFLFGNCRFLSFVGEKRNDGNVGTRFIFLRRTPSIPQATGRKSHDFRISLHNRS